MRLNIKTLILLFICTLILLAQVPAVNSGTAIFPTSGHIMIGENNLSELTTPATARTNLQLGTAATQASTVFAPAIVITTVGMLGTCNGGVEGVIKGVTDALIPAALAIVGAGGAVHVLVYCNGTNWIVL
jgi:hypothetical protein